MMSRSTRPEDVRMPFCAAVHGASPTSDYASGSPGDGSARTVLLSVTVVKQNKLVGYMIYII